MAVFKCKMCGDTLTYTPGSSSCTCESCGTRQTLPIIVNDRISSLYERAAYYRRNNEFDKAMGIYELILNDNSKDAEAYWCIVLCRYGVEYVINPKTKKRTITVNRTQVVPIYADPDYKSALRYADEDQLSIYQREAKYIDQIQRGILEISSKENPYDIFICYKEKDDKGDRTQDSVFATDIYEKLTKNGYRVFFSRITLEDKLGQAYEPYIYAAINSAKVMIVISTKKEYFESPWVKNEWSRFMTMIKPGDEKTIIPVYYGLSASDLPLEFAYLQGQDLSKVGAIQNLVRGIQKIIPLRDSRDFVKGNNKKYIKKASIKEDTFNNCYIHQRNIQDKRGRDFDTERRSEAMNEYKINQYTYEAGHVFYAEDGAAYKVTGFLGAGGQGAVYKVKGPDGEYALKWYHKDKCLKKIRAEEFYNELRKKVENGVPSLSTGDKATQFIWPLKMIKKADDSFGYLMNLFPKGYEPLKNVFNMQKKDHNTGKTIPLYWKSHFATVTAALNIVRAFEILHSSGYSYQDLNDGGIYVNMTNGDALICDCDNVAEDLTNLGIRGIMTYMAPEVVRGEKLPDVSTDEYSLAVILFRLFLHGHPMCGVESRELHNSENISQYDADIRIYGTHPHYCLALGDNPNPPDPKWNKDVCILSFVYPVILMDAFDQVFTKGIMDPFKRYTATEWRKVLFQVRDSLILVNGKEEFYGVRKEKPLPEECRTLIYPNGRRVLCMPGKVLFSYHLKKYGTDFKTPVAEIIASPKNPNVLGLINHTGRKIRISGEKIPEMECPEGGKIPLLKGIKIEFEKTFITVE